MAEPPPSPVLVVGLGGMGLAAARLRPLVHRQLPGVPAAALATAVLMVGLRSLEGLVEGALLARLLPTKERLPEPSNI